MRRALHPTVTLPTILLLVVTTVLLARWAFAERGAELSSLADGAAQEVGADLRRVLERDVAALTALVAELGDPAEVSEPRWSTLVRRTWSAGGFREVAAVNLGVLVDTDTARTLGSQRSSQDPDFDLRLGPGPQHVVLLQVWPRRPNLSALGFDVTRNPTAAEVVERAGTSGRPLASPPIRLVQETQGQRATVIYLPITGPGTPGGTLGFANLAFRATAVLERVRPPGTAELTLRWVDVATGDALAELGPRRAGAASAVELAPYGPTWRVEVQAPLSALTPAQRWLPWTVTAVGTLLTAAVAGAVVSASAARRRAERLAERRGEDLEVRARQLRAANEQLQELHASKDRVLRSVTHDLRNPITVAGGLAGVLLEHDPPEPQRRELLARIAHQATRLESMVDELATASRLQDGQVRPQRQVLALVDLARQVAAEQEVATVAGEEAVLALADPAHVERIVTNLLTNARRYGEPPIEVTVRTAADEVELVVRDHGAGVDPQDRDRIFREFTRLRSAGDGLGLGLAISAGLAEVNGGSLRYEDAPDGGARFVLRLPAAPDPAAPAGGADADPEARQLPAPGVGG